MKVLVANRGEIAVRIIASIQAMNMQAVAVYTDVDANALHVWAADEAILLDGAQGYSDIGQLIAIAGAAGVKLVHPGYGFLSQSAVFAKACQQAGLYFVGPSAEALATIGNKAIARELAQKLKIAVPSGVAVCPQGEQAIQLADQIGYPVLLKAACGGGGRGMRRVDHPEELPRQFAAAAREASNLYGSSDLLLEKLIFPARHIEVQILVDAEKVHILGERECSLQRRYQKVVEESPSSIDAALSQQLFDASKRLLTALDYRNAGTVEFLVDQHNQWTFLEVNPRLQVEHPVTEAIYQMDMVAAQIAIALGESLSHFGSPRGHAIEVRLNAEDPAADFMPTQGKILALKWPQLPWVRCDVGIQENDTISSHYDNLLAKLIAWGATREQARRRLLQALTELVLLGVVTNQAFLIQLLQSAEFCQYQTFTHTLTAHPPQLPLDPLIQQVTTAMPLVSAPDLQIKPANPWQMLAGFRMK